jgi:hypothetical protein
MNPDASTILMDLQRVAVLRKSHAADLVLGRQLKAVKRFQHQRFSRTYQDLLELPSQGAAARFFLEDLYGPADFSERDDQFVRIVPALVRLFPGEIVGTVSRLSSLHALSEELDTEMARQLGDELIDTSSYRRAWQSTGHPEQRRAQIDLMLEVGEALSRYTRRPMLRSSLRLMRGPARIAGLGKLQEFLERGFDTFHSLGDPAGFLATITTRERRIVDWLFEEPVTLPRPEGFE